MRKKKKKCTSIHFKKTHCVRKDGEGERPEEYSVTLESVNLSLFSHSSYKKDYKFTWV